jgi:lysophospholipase L1-like esterase
VGLTEYGDKMRVSIQIVITSFALLIIIEIILRLFYVDESVFLKLNYRNQNREVNSSGIKIAMLGDSFTYGSKVAEDETSSYQLQEILRERLKRSDVYVDNYGISGLSTIEEYVIFTKLVKNRDYDFVILNFFIDDFTPYYYYNNLLNPYIVCQEYFSPLECKISFIFKSRLVEFLYTYYDILKTRLETHSPITPISYMIHKMRRADSLRYRCAKGMLAQLGREIQNTGKKGIFVLIPSLTLYDNQNPYPEEIAGYETEAMLIAKESGFEVIDTLVELRDELDQRHLVKGDMHYNKEGYRLIANLIAERVLRLIGSK